MYSLPAQRRDVWMETELGYEVAGLEVSMLRRVFLRHCAIARNLDTVHWRL